MSLWTCNHPTVEEGNGWNLLFLCGARLFFPLVKYYPKEYKSTTTITMMRVQLLSAREIQHTPIAELKGKIQEKILYLRLFNS